MLETVLELAGAWNISVNGLKAGKPERPTIDWGDGVINDITEMVEVETKRIDAGISSRADAIVTLDKISQDEAKKKVKDIDDEGKINPPAPTNNTANNVNTNQPNNQTDPNTANQGS